MALHPDQPSREGRRFAQLFRKYRGLTGTRCCDLDAILLEDEIELACSQSEEPGYAACLIRSPAVSGIILPRGQTGGRRRFSIAHELGHFHIWSHREVQGPCLDSDMRARNSDSARREWEANDFAAELLMPRRLFGADAAHRDVSIASAAALAGPTFYDVSVMAAAWRIVQTTREAAALVVSTAGHVTWIAKSPSFDLWLPEHDQRLNPDTLAAAGFRDEGFAETPQAVSFTSWIESTRPHFGELLESTYSIERLNQVVSLLWHVNSDSDAYDGLIR